MSKGCLFHLAQCVYRKVQANGLQQKYTEDEQFNLNIKMIPALAFVPEDAVEEAFESLADNTSADAQPILDYFEDTFIGRP
jgi:glycine cleavage system regulatory protein